MTNSELQKILQRFPPEGVVQVRRAGPTTQAEPVDRAEMAIDASPLRLTEQNVGWADLVKEKIQVVLIFGEPKTTLAQDPPIPMPPPVLK